jgi:hypothetical protein
MMILGIVVGTGTVTQLHSAGLATGTVVTTMLSEETTGECMNVRKESARGSTGAVSFGASDVTNGSGMAVYRAQT